MRQIVGFVIVGTIGVILGAGGLGLYSHQAQVVTPTKVVTNPASDAPSHAAMTGDYEHMTPEEKAEADKRTADAVHTIATIADLYLTGDRNGHAEWVSASTDTVTCGVTPEGRYYIVKNALGKTRYDEPWKSSRVLFEKAWSNVNCEATAPIHQAALLAKAQEEQLYQETHPLDANCVLRQIGEWSTNRNPDAVAKRQRAHPHECNRTPAQLEATERAQAEQRDTVVPGSGDAPNQ